MREKEREKFFLRLCQSGWLRSSSFLPSFLLFCGRRKVMERERGGEGESGDRSLLRRPRASGIDTTKQPTTTLRYHRSLACSQAQSNEPRLHNNLHGLKKRKEKGGIEGDKRERPRSGRRSKAAAPHLPLLPPRAVTANPRHKIAMAPFWFYVPSSSSSPPSAGNLRHFRRTLS